MFIGFFTERPYQDPSSDLLYGRRSRPFADLSVSNSHYDPQVGSDLYNRYIDQVVLLEELGFDGVMLNEHHSAPSCMGSLLNIEAAVLARATEKLKIVLLGNVTPIWDNPLQLVEELNEIDMISRGRLVSGWIRGTGRESVAYNAQPPYNWERFQEAHELILKAWTTPGPFRWEGEHYHLRYVNPWSKPYQQPHPPIWVPGVGSKNTIDWAVRRHYPYIVFTGEIESTKAAYDYYDEQAAAAGWTPGPEHKGCIFKLHVEETEEKALEVARKYLTGPANPFIPGNQGVIEPWIMSMPGMIERGNVISRSARSGGPVAAGLAAKNPAAQPFLDDAALKARTDARQATYQRDIDNDDLPISFSNQVSRMTIICGTPTSVIPKIRLVLETLRPGAVFFWDGDGSMTYDDTERSLTLMANEVFPAVREMSEELNLTSPFDVDQAELGVGVWEPQPATV